jgi:hypothetical protein
VYLQRVLRGFSLSCESICTDLVLNLKSACWYDLNRLLLMHTQARQAGLQYSVAFESADLMTG